MHNKHLNSRKVNYWPVYKDDTFDEAISIKEISKLFECISEQD
jgi:hypothetical protein